MRTPKGPNGRKAKFCRWAQDWYDTHWSVRWIAVPVIVGLPPGVITAGYSVPAFSAWLTHVLPEVVSTPLRHSVHDYVALFLFFAAAWPALFNAIGNAIIRQNKNNGLSVESLLALIGAVDEVVASKALRFRNAQTDRSITKENAFEVITQPRKQIEELVRGICGFFNATRSESQKHSLIRVTLAVVQDKKINSLPIWFPLDEPPHADLPKLNNARSTFSIALKEKRMVIISDIAKELAKRGKESKRFVDTGNQADNVGSLICYPVKCRVSADIPYLIAIHCDVPGYFKAEFRDLYEHGLERFVTRIDVEHNLLVLKENLCA